MGLQASLIVPSKQNRLNPCCCISNGKELIRIPINIMTVAGGFAAVQNLVVNEIDYIADINITRGANTLSGIAKFTKIRHNRIHENILAVQTTAYPTLPFTNEWHGLKLYGLGDFASLELSNDLILNPGAGVNSNVSGKLDLELWDISNKILDTKSARFNMTGDDASGWQYNLTSELDLTINDFGASPITYYIKLSSFNVGLKPGSANCAGDLKIIRADDSSNATRTWSFNSGPTDSKHNSQLPWINSWALVDTSVPFESLTPFDQIDLGVPPIYRLRAVISVSGS